MIFNLGVSEGDYSVSDHPEETTGAVAKDLEARYGIMSDFADRFATGYVTDQIVDGIWDGGFDNEKQKKTSAQVVGEFRKNIELQMFDHLDGVPTNASVIGWDSIKKEATGITRPSFLDTHTYSEHFEVWTE